MKRTNVLMLLVIVPATVILMAILMMSDDDMPLPPGMRATTLPAGAILLPEKPVPNTMPSISSMSSADSVTTPSTMPATPSPIMPVEVATPTTQSLDRPPTFFRFQYQSDPKQPVRDWQQIDEITWVETYHGNKKTKYELVGPSDDPKDPGVILTRLPDHGMEVYVPLMSNPDRRLGWRYPEGKKPKDAPANDMPWYTLGTIEEER
jgi:hypothetical protein